MNYFGRWMRNARSLALVQSLMPAVLAVVMSISSENFNWILALLAVVGVAFAHLAMNLADDYFDYKADMLSDRDKIVRQGFRAMMVKYPYLTDNSENLKTTRRAIALFLAIAAICGLVIISFRFFEKSFLLCIAIAIIVAVTAFLGIFYSAPPLKLAYRGLGELVIGLIFGPLLMDGVYMAASGSFSAEISWVSLPVGLLVINILYTHSLIERVGDAASNKMTFARLLGGDKAALAASYVFNLLPFALIVAAVVFGYLHIAYLAVLLLLPAAIWLCGSLKAFVAGKTEVPQCPPRFLGAMGDWKAIKEAGVEWFMMRWLAARNLLGHFCGLMIIVKIILICVN